MRNDLGRLVWVPGDIQRAEVMPRDEEGQRILAGLIHRAQHDDGQFDDEDETMIMTASDLYDALITDHLHCTEHDGSSYRRGVIGTPSMRHYLLSGVEVSNDAVDALLASGKIIAGRWSVSGLHTRHREYGVPVSPAQQDKEESLTLIDELNLIR